jgi:hypothetical protein
MARIKRVGPTRFKSEVISNLLERLPALQPWPKDTHDLYTKPPSGSEVKAGIWHRLEDLSTAYELATRTDAEGDSNDFSHARDVILEYLECNFPEELEQLQNTGSINIRAIAASDDETRTKQAHFKELKEQNAKLEWTQELLIKEVERKFPGVFGNRGLGDADPVNLLVNRIMNEGRERPLEWIFSEIERALPDARKVAGAMYRNIEIKEQTAKLEQEIKKVEEECNFWREATLKLSKEVPADDETMARLGWTKEYK